MTFMDLRHQTLFPNEGDGMPHDEDDTIGPQEGCLKAQPIGPYYGPCGCAECQSQSDEFDVGLLEYHIAEQFDGMYVALAQGKLLVEDFLDLRNNVMTLLRRLHPDDDATPSTQDVDMDIPF